MDQDATWYGGRPRPRRHCVRWGPSSPRKGAQQPPTFTAAIIIASLIKKNHSDIFKRRIKWLLLKMQSVWIYGSLRKRATTQTFTLNCAIECDAAMHAIRAFSHAGHWVWNTLAINFRVKLDSSDFWPRRLVITHLWRSEFNVFWFVPIIFSSCGFLLMAALWNRAGHYVFVPWFLLLLSSFFFPRLLSAVGDWISTILPHMLCP